MCTKKIPLYIVINNNNIMLTKGTFVSIFIIFIYKL